MRRVVITGMGTVNSLGKNKDEFWENIKAGKLGFSYVDKFDTEAYGFSGEGSMAFGYGTYLTGSKEIAIDYAERQGEENAYGRQSGYFTWR